MGIDAMMDSMLNSSSLTGRVRRALAASLLLGLSATAYAGCRNTPTEIVAGVTTQLQVPKFLSSVGVTVQIGGRVVFCQSYDVVNGVANLPSTIGTIPNDQTDGAPTEPVTIQILGFRQHQDSFSSDCLTSIPDVGQQEVFVVRRQRMPYVPDRILYMPMPLKESCSNVDCADDETCIGSICESMDVDSSALQDYRDEFVFGDANTCFSSEQCMPEQALVPALIQDDKNCTFRVPWPDEAPAPSAGDLNVRIVYDTFATEILDLDAKEGFVFPDDKDPLTFRLASNMCEGLYKQGRIIAIQAAALCPAKRALQPICSDDLTKILSGDTNVAGGPVNLCTQGTALSQTESALYILMDSSQAMVEFFGPQGLAVAVNTPLENPIAARTRIAFASMPAANCAADADYVNSPAVPFGVVADVREPIGEFLGNVGNVLAGNPDINLEPAMRGAYTALGGLTPNASQQFNRRALIIVGNRSYEGSCGGPSFPVDLATQAFNSMFGTSRIHTYVAALDAPAGTPNVGDPVGVGSAIAQNGGTQLFDAVNDEAEGAKSVQEVINDLGTCLYDAPVAGVFDGDIVPDDANLSYLDPISLERTDIPKNAACTEGSMETGWNQEAVGQPVRICGAACDALRDMLNEVSLTYAVLGEPAPRIPIQVTTPCRGD
jgi:hypothetical protein